MFNGASPGTKLVTTFLSKWYSPYVLKILVYLFNTSIFLKKTPEINTVDIVEIRTLEGKVGS